MSIADFLSRLFNIRSGEWRRLLLLYSMSLAALTGCTWADAIVQGAFLQRVGVQYLPWVFISSAACSFGAMFVYSAFADRVSNTRLLIALLVISGASILLGLAALAGGLVGPAYLLLFLVLQVPLLDVYNVHWATYVNGFYDIRTAKRIVPVLSTAARLAGIIAGLSMPLMNRLLSPAGILAVAVASLGVMAILAAALPRLLREQRARPGGWSGSSAVLQAASSPSYSTRLREGYQQIARSPLLRWMALSALCMTILMTLLNYGASAIFQEELKTTVAISNFTGVLSGVANLVILPFQMFLLSRLIARLGLGNASLVYPLATLATAGSLAIAPGLGMAALAYLDRTALRTAFRIPTDNLLYNAVPLRVKARTRAFVGGLVVPIGAILGGLLLLTGLMRTSWFLPAALLILGLAFALAALMVRRHYGQALVDLLDQEDYFSLGMQVPSLQEPTTLAADQATIARLAQKLDESTSPERTIFMAQLITAVGGEAAVPIVGQAARSAADSRLRASLVDVLVAADVRRGGARELYSELLADADAQVRLSGVSGLEQIDGPRDRRYLEAAAALLTDPEIEVRLRVLPALVVADDLGRRTAGTDELRALLKSPDPQTRARALYVIGRAHAFGFLLELVRSLTDSADEVRLAAGLATEALASDELLVGKRDMLLVLALLLLHDPIERARVAAVTVLDRLNKDSGPGAAAARESLVEGLADPSPEVRGRTVEALVRASRRAIPLVHEQLNAADPHLRKMAAVVLARIEPRKYASLILGANLSDNLLTIYRNLSCLHALAGCPGPAVAVLGQALRERNTALLDELFYLLSTVRDPAAIETVVRSLHSPQPEMRANAVEALEWLTSPQTAALVGPLFEPELPAEPLLSLAKQTWDISIPTPAAVVRVLLGDASDAWQRTLAAAALGELNSSVDPGSDVEMAELLTLARADPDAGVRAEVSVAAAGAASADGRGAKEDIVLSAIEKVIFLKEVPFFQGMGVEQLRVLANVCEEVFFPAGACLFNQGEPGGVLYVVVSGRVGIEQEKRKGSFARLATVEAHSYLGETNFFDDSSRSHSAIALQDTLALRMRREPLIALARQHPDLSLELINVLSFRLREATDRVADLTRTHPRELHRLFDQLT